MKLFRVLAAVTLAALALLAACGRVSEEPTEQAGTLGDGSRADAGDASTGDAEQDEAGSDRDASDDRDDDVDASPCGDRPETGMICRPECGYECGKQCGDHCGRSCWRCDPQDRRWDSVVFDCVVDCGAP